LHYFHLQKIVIGGIEQVFLLVFSRLGKPSHLLTVLVLNEWKIEKRLFLAGNNLIIVPFRDFETLTHLVENQKTPPFS